MKIYKYKINWLFNINYYQEVKDMFAMLKIIGIRSLTSINFLDNNYKTIYSYTHMVSHTDVNGFSAFRKFWNKLKKTDDFMKLFFVEFLR